MLKRGCEDFYFYLTSPSFWSINTKKKKVSLSLLPLAIYIYIYICSYREKLTDKVIWKLFNQRCKSLRPIWIDFWELNIKMDFIFWQQGVIFFTLDAVQWKNMFVLFMILITYNFLKNVDKFPIYWAG